MGKTSSAVKRRYNDKTYDRITISVRKDENTVARIKVAADLAGESVNTYIVGAVENRIQREKQE